MKKIFLALSVLFTFVAGQANSQQIDLTIGSANGAIGTIVNIPVEMYFPQGSQQVGGMSCYLQLSDPSKAEIIGVTAANPLVTGGVTNGGSGCNFGFTSSVPVSQIEGLLVTLQVEIKGLGCTDLSLVDDPYTSQVLIDGVLFDDLIMDYNITEGKVCGIADCTMPPFDLSCDLMIDNNGEQQTLSWLPVLTAVSYEIEFFFNDPFCCAGVIGPKYSVIVSAGSATSFDVPSSFRCFKWRVRATCADGTTTIWSRNSCSCGSVTSGGPGFISAGEITELLDVKTVPNPAKNFVEVSLNGPKGEVELSASEVVIYAVSGQEVYRSNIALNEAKTIDLSSFDPGVYILNIVENGMLLSNEKLIVK